MAEACPTMEERDRCLDELVIALTQGRLDSAEFARRSDQIIAGTSRRDLAAALEGIRPDLQPQVAVARYQPRPHVPTPQPGLYGPPPGVGRRTNMRRRQMFVTGGVIAFAGIFGIGLLGVAMSNSSPGPMHAGPYPPPAETPMPTDYLRQDLGAWLPGPWLSGAISQVLITADSITLWAKPMGEGWQEVVIGKEGLTTTTPAKPGANIFDLSEANVAVISEVVERSADMLKDSVKSVEFVRKQPEERVVIVVTGTKGGHVTWDALDRTVKELVKTK